MSDHPHIPMNWNSFVPTERAVILFVREDDRLLLIEKKRGLGHGKVNGPGGRIESGETAYDAAVRETREEVGLVVSDLTERAFLSFQFVDGYALEVTVFTTRHYSGTPVETAEARPFWCPTLSIPYDRMWADDRHWLPSVLAGRYVRGYFLFDEDHMLESSVSERAPS